MEQANRNQCQQATHEQFTGGGNRIISLDKAHFKSNELANVGTFLT